MDMDKSFSRKRLIVELLRRGVSPAYSCRVSGELADHCEDLNESGEVTSARLGNVDELAAQIVESFRRRTFAGRHPILSFAVVPFPLMILVMIVYWHLGALLIYASGLVMSYPGYVALLVDSASMFAPQMIITALLCRQARGAGLNWKRITLACLPILAVAFLLNSSLTLDGLNPEVHGSLSFGLNLPVSRFAMLMFWIPLGRVALPTCVMVLMFLRERVQSRQLVLQGLEGEVSRMAGAARQAA